MTDLHLHQPQNLTILQAVLQFILPRLMERKRAHRNSKSRRGKKPYILLVSGPQGSGKSTLVRELRADLKTRGLGVAIMSLDDLYLTYEEQKRLTQGTKNPLWRGRGLPGTHDVELGRRVMQALVEGRTVRLPRFDKAANHGMGDRSAEGVLVGQSPVDVVLFEGWCLGYRSMQEGELEEAWTRESSSLPSSLQGQVSLKDVQEVNEQLRQGIEPWLERADGVVEIRTKEISTIYNWREGAEAQLRTVSGQGLSVEEVRRMVDRFAVMYQLWWPWMRTKDQEAMDGKEYSGDPAQEDKVSRAMTKDRVVLELDEQRRILDLYQGNWGRGAEVSEGTRGEDEEEGEGEGK